MLLHYSIGKTSKGFGLKDFVKQLNDGPLGGTRWATRTQHNCMDFTDMYCTQYISNKSKLTNGCVTWTSNEVLPGLSLFCFSVFLSFLLSEKKQ